MSYRPLTLLLLLGTLGHAAPPLGLESAKLPDDAARLRQTYQQNVERAVQPLRDRYLADLKRLLETYTRAGKLAEALAIKSELEGASSAGSGATGGETVAAFERRLIGTKWTWADAFTFEFEAGGKTSRGGIRWKSTRPLTVEYDFPNGSHGTITLERDLSRGAITETQKGGKVLEMSLERAPE